MEKEIDLERNGTAQAAVLAAMTGLLTLALANLGTEISEKFKEAVHGIGKLWMPGAQGIGPYSGKETLALVVWLLSWLILHQILRSREWNNRIVLVVFLIGIAIATTLIWPPVFNGIAHTIKGG